MRDPLVLGVVATPWFERGYLDCFVTTKEIQKPDQEFSLKSYSLALDKCVVQALDC